MNVDHVGLNVTDLSAMTAWYVAALGLEVEFETELFGGELRIAMLLCPDGHRVELLSRRGVEGGLRAADPAEAALTLGYSHFALDVPSVDEAYESLLTAGAVDKLSPRPSPEAGVRMAFVADPEGNLIELLDRTTAQGRA